jgi:ectoine hydroxylase-related dioxygenase (phytanoyl-CoA dioxygenase family)
MSTPDLAAKPPAPFLAPDHITDAREAVADEGYLLIPGGYDVEACRSIVRLIDTWGDPAQHEINYSGTELRVWDAQSRDPRLAEFTRQSDAFLTAMTGREMRAHTLLAIRNLALAPDDARSTLGRWHLDSFKQQLKIFLFLTDTTEESGPFEFFPRTHRARFKVPRLLEGRYLSVGDMLAGKRTYSSLDETWIQALIDQGYAPLPVVCPAGTILVVDSSAVHRARPCRQGSRYALTAYYR